MAGGPAANDSPTAGRSCSASVGFWNFLGAGVFGFLINLPVVSYYEIGTQLTANHAHAAMMGVYGMLAISLLVFCLRYLLRPEDWNERLVGFSFWALNLGLAWMVFANLSPSAYSNWATRWPTATGTPAPSSSSTTMR